MNQVQSIPNAPKKISGTQKTEKYENIKSESENFSSLLKKTISKDDKKETEKSSGSELKQDINKGPDQVYNDQQSSEFQIEQNYPAADIIQQLVASQSAEQNLSSGPAIPLTEDNIILQAISTDQISISDHTQIPQNVVNAEFFNDFQTKLPVKGEQPILSSADANAVNNNLTLIQSQVEESSEQILKSENGVSPQRPEILNSIPLLFEDKATQKTEKEERPVAVVSNMNQLKTSNEKQTDLPKNEIIGTKELKVDLTMKKEIFSSENSTQKDQMKVDDSETIKTENIPLFTGESQVIKVSDSSSEIGQPISRQIGQETLTNIKNNISEFKMQLNPKDLGEISVKMLSKNGILTVELSAANPKTQDLLSMNAESIRSILQTTNEKTIEISCPQQEQANYHNMDQQSSGSDGRQHRQQEQNDKPDDDSMFSETNKFLSFMQQIRQAEIQAI